jgi:putative ATP-dependent endonuclease of the OLD family
MKLSRLRIEGFRSIRDTSLDECGSFNVIIGKNNAGKSNLLSCIHAFFTALRNGHAISLNPPLGQPYDFYDSESNTPIRITAGLQLSSQERDALVANIIAEAPQMKNSLASLGPAHLIVVNLEAHARPRNFAAVRAIQLHDGKSERVLLTLSDAAMHELVSLAERADLLEQQSAYIGRLLERIRPYSEQWDTLRSGRQTGFWRLILSQERVPDGVDAMLENILKTADTYTSFNAGLQSAAEKLRKDSAALGQSRLREPVETFSGQDTALPKYALALLAALGATRVQFFTERRQQIGRREAEQILQLKVKRGGSETLTRIQQTVSELLGVGIDAFEGTGRGEGAELDVDKFLVQVNGAGIREALRIVLDYELRKPALLLVEEPEIHLHPALETSMMRYLKAIGQDCQIFITTHSTNFLDAAEMKNVYLAQRLPDTQVQMMTLDEAESSIPRELGIRLSSLFMFDRLVFVEGPSDADVIREIAALVGVNLAQASVGFVPMGGARNLAHFGAERTITFLTKRRVRMWFVLDRDEKDEEDVRALVSKLSSQASLCVLDRREMENYLVCPRAVAAFIGLKQRLGGLPERGTEDEVRDAIAECAETLRSTAVQRRIVKRLCSPIFMDRQAVLEGEHDAFVSNVESLLAKGRDYLGEQEKRVRSLFHEETERIAGMSGEDLVRTVPGDELLDCVCNKFGVRFIKARDAGRLAGLLRLNEIDSSLTEFVREVSRM